MKPKAKKRRPITTYPNWKGDEVKDYLSLRIMEKFEKWIYGQTCPVLKDGSCGYFAHDVIRFADAILEGKKPYWD